MFEVPFNERINVPNLKKLSAYLRSLPPDYKDFDMATFCEGDRHYAQAHTHCGTAACAIGHGPNAGIAPLRDETWADYSRRFIDNTTRLPDSKIYNAAWLWCFGEDWADSDNTPHGAAGRIDYLLAHKALPHDWQDQMYRDE